MTQQEPGELLACPAQGMHRIKTGAHQVADRLMSGVRDPYRRQLTRPIQSRQADRIPLIGLHPLAGPLRDQRGCDHDAVVSARRQLTLNAVAAWPRLVAEPQLHPLTAELARQTIQGTPRVRNAAVLPDLAASTTLGYRYDNPLLVNIKPDISDTIPHDPSPMHEARHRTIRRNPRYLHTVRRVAPSSGGHLV